MSSVHRASTNTLIIIIFGVPSGKTVHFPLLPSLPNISVMQCGISIYKVRIKDNDPQSLLNSETTVT